MFKIRSWTSSRKYERLCKSAFICHLLHFPTIIYQMSDTTHILFYLISSTKNASTVLLQCKRAHWARSRVSVATDFYSNLEFLTKRCKDRNVKSRYKKWILTCIKLIFAKLKKEIRHKCYLRRLIFGPADGQQSLQKISSELLLLDGM